MPFYYNGTLVQNVTYNGVIARNVTFRDSLVFHSFKWEKYALTSVSVDFPVGSASLTEFTAIQLYYSSAKPSYNTETEKYGFTDTTTLGALQVGDNVPCSNVNTIAGSTVNESHYYGNITSKSEVDPARFRVTINCTVYERRNVQAKGDYIEDVFSVNENEYPDNSVKDGYWYVKVN